MFVNRYHMINKQRYLTQKWELSKFFKVIIIGILMTKLNSDSWTEIYANFLKPTLTAQMETFLNSHYITVGYCQTK